VQYVIAEYYPDSIGDYLIKKERLLKMAKKGQTKGKRILSIDELLRIKQLIEDEIKDNYGTEAKYLVDDDGEGYP
jgi:hypothetical protein